MSSRSASAMTTPIELEIAAEHIRLAQDIGQTPREIMRAVGSRWCADPTWEDATRALARAWLNLEVP